MRKNYISLMVGILISLYLSTSGYSQDDKKDCCFRKKEPLTHIIEFDKDGKVISDLPERIDVGDDIKYSYKNQTGFGSQVKLELMKTLSNSISSIRSKNSIVEYGNLFPLFITNPTVDHNVDSSNFLFQMKAISKDLETFINILNQDNKIEGESIPSFDPKDIFHSKPSATAIDASMNKIEFELRIKNINTIYSEYFNKHKSLIPELPHSKKMLEYQSKFDSISNEYARFLKSNRTCEDAIKLEQVLLENDSSIEELLKLDLKTWLTKWIWLNGSSFNLNPFSQTTSTTLSESDLDKIAQIPVLESKITSWKTLIEKKENTKYDLSLVDSIAIANQLLYKARSLEDKQRQLELNKNRTYQKDELLYKGVLYTSNESNRFFMRNHDAANSYQLEIETSEYYLESDKVKYLIHNQVSNKETAINESVVPTEDMADLTKELLSIINVVYKASAQITPEKIASDNNKSKIDSNCDLSNLNAKIINFNAAKTKLYWIQRQSAVIPMEPLVADETPKYRTEEAGPTKNVEAPAKVTYVLRERPFGSHPDTVGTTVIDSVSYKVYALHRFQPFVGFAFGSVERNILNIDDNGNLISVEKENKENTFMGVKIYPKKTDIHNSKFFLCKGSDILSRINILAGMDFSNINPVDNFMLGAGFDIFPGLNLSYYGNWYKNNTYKIEQGKFIKEGRPLMFDHGFMISLDPVVIFNFAKLIAKP